MTAPFVSGQTPSPSPPLATQMQGMNPPGEMDQMATSITKMSEMYQMMMNKEMATMHYRIGAAIAVGIVLFVDLLLLAVLEVQWIRYWQRKLRA